jgi:hypothetical protein
MGCGSSSLKGEAPSSGLSGDPSPQIRKVNTNFSAINYEGSDQKKRRMTEYAPHETVRQQSHVSGIDPGKSSAGDDIGPDGERLQPYQTLGDGPNDIPLKDQSYPHEKIAGGGSAGSSQAMNGVNGVDGIDPLSGKAKEEFATTNDPINHQDTGSSSLEPPVGDEKKKRGSWIDKFKGGEKREISDEEMKKVGSD